MFWYVVFPFSFVSRFDFPFDFFFDLLAFQKWIVCFPCICQFSSFLALIDFQFHTVVVINNHLKFVETCFVVQHMVLENVPCALEKNEYSAAVGCNALDMFVSSWGIGSECRMVYEGCSSPSGGNPVQISECRKSYYPDITGSFFQVGRQNWIQQGTRTCAISDRHEWNYSLLSLSYCWWAFSSTISHLLFSSSW